jgi:hypothetical protein
MFSKPFIHVAMLIAITVGPTASGSWQVEWMSVTAARACQHWTLEARAQLGSCKETPRTQPEPSAVETPALCSYEFSRCSRCQQQQQQQQQQQLQQQHPGS